MYKQLIIARKDLKMSPGKLAAQVSHASIAFLTNQIKEKAFHVKNGIVYAFQGEVERGNWYESRLIFDEELYEQWIEGSFTKIVCGARNKSKLLEAIEIAEELGIAYYPIYDNCRTELEPEEKNGTTLTCVGFPPLDSEIIDKIGKRYHLYV